MSKGRLALDGDELLEVLDVEHRVGGIDDAPHADRRDLDGIATGVVDLDALALEIADTQRDPLAPKDREWIDPPQASLVKRPDIAAEDDQHARLVGLHHDEARANQRDPDPH